MQLFHVDVAPEPNASDALYFRSENHEVLHVASSGRLVYPERLRVSDSIEAYREVSIANLIAAALVVY